MLRKSIRKFVVKLFLTATAAAIVVLVVYIMIDMNSNALIYAESADNISNLASKEKFKISYLSNQIQEPQSGTGKDDFVYTGNIDIDESLFSELSVRLNTEIYEITASVWNQEHLKECFNAEQYTSNMAQQALEYIDPLMVLAIATEETCGYTKVRNSYTWSSAIYSKLLEDRIEADPNQFHVADVCAQSYIDAGHTNVLKCGQNCDGYGHQCYGDKSKMYQDRDSLGPLQIRRSIFVNYDETKTGLGDSEGYTCKCGKTAKDLLSWQDNCVFELSNWYVGSVMRGGNPDIMDVEVENKYQFFLFFAKAHNGWGGVTIDGIKGLATNEVAQKFQKIIYEYMETDYIPKLQGSSADLAIIPGNSSYFTNMSGMGNGEAQLWFIKNKLGLSGYTSTGYSYLVRALAAYFALEYLYYSGKEGAGI